MAVSRGIKQRRNSSYHLFFLWPCSIALILLQLFVPYVDATNPCSASQFWLVYADGTTSCEDCGSCPPGQGLSHECGKQISLNEMVTCVPCQPGSFSSQYDTSSCSPCSAPCSEDQMVLQNCTPALNVKCDKQCYSKDRYYDDLGSCMSCSKCCGDNKDVVENECEQKLGAASNMICSFLSSANRCDGTTTAASAQETTTTVLNTTTLVPFTLTRVRADAARTVTATHQSTSTQGAQSSPGLSKTKRDLDNSKNVTVIVVPVTIGLLLVIIVGCVTYFLYSRGRRSYLRCQHDPEMQIIHYSPNGSQTLVVARNEGHVACQKLPNIDKVNLGALTSAESSEPLLSKESPPPSSCVSQENAKKVSKLLSSLREHENALEGICVCLDTAVPGCGHYREVAQYYGLDHYQIVSVLEKYPGGPTRALIEKLAATHTDLTVEEFAAVVEDKTKRNDVSRRLREYDSAEN